MFRCVAIVQGNRPADARIVTVTSDPRILAEVERLIAAQTSRPGFWRRIPRWLRGAHYSRAVTGDGGGEVRS